MNQDKLTIKINGQEKTYDVYYSFTCPQTNKGYIAYSEHQKDNEGNEIILISAFDPNISEVKLYPINDQREIELVQSVFNKIKEIA